MTENTMLTTTEDQSLTNEVLLRPASWLPKGFDPIEQAKKAQNMFHGSGWFGKITKDAGGLIALHCLITGLNPIDFLRTFHMLPQGPSKKAVTMLAEFEKAGGMYQILRADPDGAKLKFEFRERTLETEITWEQAKETRWPYNKDGGLKDNWSTPMDRKNMLFKRVVSSSLDMIAPSITGGMETPEEMSERPLPDKDLSSSQPAKFMPPPLTRNAGVLDTATWPTKPKTDPDELANDLQLAKLRMLIVDAGDKMPDNAISDALTKRNINSIEELTSADCDEICDKLEDLSKK